MKKDNVLEVAIVRIVVSANQRVTYSSGVHRATLLHQIRVLMTLNME